MDVGFLRQAVAPCKHEQNTFMENVQDYGLRMCAARPATAAACAPKRPLPFRTARPVTAGRASSGTSGNGRIERR